MFRVALRLLLAAALGAVPLLVRADVYRWVDESGATHFSTTRDVIPRRYRDSATVIPAAPATVSNPSRSRPPERAAPAPSEPPPAASPRPEPTPSAEPGAAAPAPPAESGAQPTQKSDTPPAAPPASGGASSTGDPRQAEIAELEGRIERDREILRGLISTPRLDSSDLASDPRVREIAERLPRLQAELAALRKEAGR